jgi:hypothetical protein
VITVGLFVVVYVNSVLGYLCYILSDNNGFTTALRAHLRLDHAADAEMFMRFPCMYTNLMSKASRLMHVDLCLHFLHF